MIVLAYLSISDEIVSKQSIPVNILKFTTKVLSFIKVLVLVLNFCTISCLDTWMENETELC